MKKHFILQDGIWLGDGSIKLSLTDEPLKFHMRWSINKDSSGLLECVQEIEVIGLSETMYNEFFITDLTKTNFALQLDNTEMGQIEGEGFVSDNTIGWELSEPDQEFGGFEFYNLQEDGKYFMHAEYATGDALKTEIQGKIWQAASTK